MKAPEEANKELTRACKNEIKRLGCYGRGMTTEGIVECLRQKGDQVMDKKFVLRFI